jgi:hypothetical protein
MSDLENEVKPLLVPMMDGQSVRFQLPAQALITIWALKTAMVLEAIDAEHMRVYDRGECAALRTFNAVPYRTSVWIATSGDPGCLFSTKRRHLDSATAETITGISTTIGLGHFVIQVFTIRVPDSVQPTSGVTAYARPGPWNEVTEQIWPTQGGAVIWPSTMGLDGEAGLDALAERFSVQGIPAADTVALAV